MPPIDYNLDSLRLPAFEPLRWARGPHAQTILGRYWSRHRLPGTDEKHEIAVSGGDRLVVFLRRGGPEAGTVVTLFHGLGGSSDSDYMPRIADVLGRVPGAHIVLVNHRGAGAGAGLAREPYHSGRADDLAAVLAWSRERFPGARQVAVGFSLSGNALLLLLGSRQDLAQPDAAVAVSAPIDLARTSELLSSGLNRLYNRKFVWDARRDIEARRAAGLLDRDTRLPWLADLNAVDDLFTAPLGGFRDRHDYYARASSGPHLEKIRVPTVLLTAADDPFVDVASYRAAKVSAPVRLEVTEYGGHMGFLSDSPTDLGTRHWLDLAILRLVENFQRPLP